MSIEKVEDSAAIAKIIGVESKENANNSYLLYDAVVSDVAWEASEIAEKVTFVGTEKYYKRFFPNTGKVSSETLTYSGTGSEYYVYIKVIPNLSVFAYSIEHLTTYMPCFMYFSIGASFYTSVTYQSESASESLSEIVAP